MLTDSPPLHDLNPNVAAMQPSATLAMTARAKALIREGHDVISLSAGETDFDTPKAVVDAAIQALHDGFTHYTPNAGIPELREAIAEKFRNDNGLDVEPDDVLACNGAKQAVAQTVLAICRPGDEVLFPAPYWVSYPEMAHLAGATPVVVETTAEAEYKMTPEQLDAAITPSTRVLIFNSPSNPTGAVYTREEMLALVDVLQRHEHVFVLSDEIYEYVLFDAKHVAIGSLPGMNDRTITVNGFSKGYAMTGWRIGYMAGPRWIVDAADKIQSQFTSAPCSITQKAALAALRMSKEPIEQMVTAFRERRNFMIERLRKLPDVICPRPEGAFYLFPDVSAYYGKHRRDGDQISGSDDMCMYLLEEHGVALVAGKAFGSDAGVRVSYASSLDELGRAADRIEAGLAQLVD
ncbi:MAG: pyridoxal phosphate-dependent aminotransferase [Rubricoccaceae bacterium]|nr:pyridoxal phosphate-dependent aminotransferase [Rubricoccaceae bacterium]